MAYISFENLHKSFGNNHVLDDINLEIEEGQLVTLLGPSGCGKSTLLRCLAGLEDIDRGRIFIDGVDVTQVEPQHRNIGMVFQQYSLFPNMTVAENIAFGLKRKKMKKEEIIKKVSDIIEMVELTGKERAYPDSLSGGQQQRVALARAIVTRPKVLLLDEPLSAIDAKLRKSLQLSIRKIQKELGITSVFVTHDQDEAMIMSDVIHLMNQGVIEQSGTPIGVYTGPKTRFAAEFIGHYNILTTAEFFRITGIDLEGFDSVALRPEAMEISQTPFDERKNYYQFKAVVKNHLSHGNVLRYTVEAAGVPLQVDVLFRSFYLYENDQQVYIAIESRNCLAL